MFQIENESPSPARDKTQKTPNGEMMVKIGHIQTMVMGGPYEYYHDHLAGLPRVTGVLMAAELQHMKHEIVIPTQDFSIPDPTTFRLGLVQVIARMHAGELIYVGCMGGIGRTGLFMAGLAKVMLYDKPKLNTVDDPIEYVRANYLPSAVETPEQKVFIKTLFLDDIAKWARSI